MSLIKFRNFTAASRKPHLVAFGLVPSPGIMELDRIESIEGGTIGMVNSGDFQNYTLSASPDPTALIVELNGLAQLLGTDYNILPPGNRLQFLSPLAPDDIVWAFVAGGLPRPAATSAQAFEDVPIIDSGDHQHYSLGFSVPPGLLIIVLDGNVQSQGVDYTLSGLNVTFSIANPATSVVLAFQIAT